MADHRIERVDRLVGKQPRQAEQRAPEQGCGDAIRSVLGEAFDGGAGDGGLVQVNGRTSDDAAQRIPRSSDPRSVERLGDIRDVIVQRARCNQAGGDEGHQG